MPAATRKDVRRVLAPVKLDEAAQEGAGEYFQRRDFVHAARCAASHFGPTSHSW